MNKGEAVTGLFIMGFFPPVTLVQFLIRVLAKCFRERSDGVECIAAFDSYSAAGYVIRCNQRERRTSRSHQHLHVAVLCELERIHCAASIPPVCARVCPRVCVFAGVLAQFQPRKNKKMV